MKCNYLIGEMGCTCKYGKKTSGFCIVDPEKCEVYKIVVKYEQQKDEIKKTMNSAKGSIVYQEFLRLQEINSSLLADKIVIILENKELNKKIIILNAEIRAWEKLLERNHDANKKLKIELDEYFKKNEELNKYINSLEGKLLKFEKE